MAEKWPRLSQTLQGPRDIHACQSCSVHPDDPQKITLWQEHDVNDKPEPILVPLCESCSKKLIEPHPRLYRQLTNHEPFPGGMPCCIGCRYSAALTCANPLLKSNGGPGLPLNYPPPTQMHISCRPRSKSGWYTVFHGPVTCKGREEAIHA